MTNKVETRKTKLKRHSPTEKEFIAEANKLFEDVKKLLENPPFKPSQRDYIEATVSSTHVELLACSARLNALIDYLCEKGTLNKARFNVEYYALLKASLEDIKKNFGNVTDGRKSE